jgi:heparosan-N-sulfate-glucuronate 5-epimerase
MRIGKDEAPGGAGFFSSAKHLVLPLGPASDPAGVRGYPIDFRIKAQSQRWPPDGLSSPSDRYVPLAQYGLGCYERFLAGEGDGWLEAAVRVGRYLVEHQESDGSWLNYLAFTHTFLLDAPWRCAMAQGEAASLLVRVYLETKDDSFADAARKGLQPLWRPRDEAGVCASLDGSRWPEEYPTDPPSFVLNGAIFTWWGVRDVGIALDDSTAKEAFAEGVETLATNLRRFDTGHWSLYCLYPHPIPTIASSFYHVLHITQLEAMNALAPRPEFEQTRARWITYFDSRPLRWRAFAQKVIFRLIVPRNRLLGDKLPWLRPRNQTAPASR